MVSLAGLTIITCQLRGSAWLSRPLWICTGTRITGAHGRSTASTGSRANAHQKMARRLLLVPAGISGRRCGAGWGCRYSRLNFRSRARAEDPARWRGPLTPLVRTGPGDGRTAPDDVDVWMEMRHMAVASQPARVVIPWPVRERSPVSRTGPGATVPAGYQPAGCGRSGYPSALAAAV